MLKRTHQPQWGSPEPRQAEQLVYCSQLSTGTLLTCARTHTHTHNYISFILKCSIFAAVPGQVVREANPALRAQMKEFSGPHVAPGPQFAHVWAKPWLR